MDTHQERGSLQELTGHDRGGIKLVNGTGSADG